MRAALLERSPFNVVEIDLPGLARWRRPVPARRRDARGWTLEGILAADREEALWALEQEYEGPDGSRHTRRGFLCRVRVTDYGPGHGPPARAHAARPQGGPPAPDPGDAPQPLPHLLPPRGQRLAPPRSRPPTGEPWGEATDADGTVNRLWRIADPAVIEAVQASSNSSELLIADGHHRYETARTYADQVGGDGEHRYTLMALVSLEDPGLTVFGYHRLLTDLGDPAKQEALGGTRSASTSRSKRCRSTSSTRRARRASASSATRTPTSSSGFRLRLKDPAAVDAELADYSEDYRRLDAAILETLVLRGALGMTPQDVEAKKGMAYTASADEAIGRLGDGADAVFLMRPTPVDQVRAVAAAGETMPPKSTYFYPKLLTGLVFNPLE